MVRDGRLCETLLPGRDARLSELPARLEMVERQADPGHVKLTLPSVNRLDEILTAKLDWTAKRSKRPLCDVQRWLGNVDADVATDASASERCGRPGRSAAGEIGEDKALFRLVQKNFVKRDVDLVMAVVTGGY